jgi:hypothetical protein
MYGYLGTWSRFPDVPSEALTSNHGAISRVKLLHSNAVRMVERVSREVFGTEISKAGTATNNELVRSFIMSWSGRRGDKL